MIFRYSEGACSVRYFSFGPIRLRSATARGKEKNREERDLFCYEIFENFSKSILYEKNITLLGGAKSHCSREELTTISS